MSNKEENKVPSAEALYDNFAQDVNNSLAYIKNKDQRAVHRLMIEFAQMHVERALNAANQNSLIKGVHENGTVQLIAIYTKEGIMYTVDRDSILNVYPKENIK